MLQLQTRQSRAASSINAAIVMIAVLLVWGCGDSNQKTSMEQKKPLGVGDTNSANAKLAKSVKDKLDADARVRSADIAVSADVTRNAVTLSGTVDSEEVRRRAVELARESQAGVLVNDRLQIREQGTRKGP